MGKLENRKANVKRNIREMQSFIKCRVSCKVEAAITWEDGQQIRLSSVIY